MSDFLLGVMVGGSVISAIYYFIYRCFGVSKRADGEELHDV